MDDLSCSALDAGRSIRSDASRSVRGAADNEGPFYFLLDTGTDTTIVDTTLAKKLALATLQSAQLTTISGSHTVGVSRLATLAIGGKQVDDLPVFQEDLSSLRRIDGRIAGIVGQDFLSQSNYLLDYRARCLRFEEGDDIRDGIDGDSVPIETGENGMILAAKAQFHGHAELRLLLDSGTNTLVLMGSVSNRLHCLMEQQVMAISNAGAAPMRIGQVDLTVASHELRDVPVTLASDASPQNIVDGLLPMAFFEAIYVNNKQSLVVLNPRAKKTVRLAAAAGLQ
jgi:hypothetical protein